MALHPDFPESPHAIIDPSVCWLPDQSLLFDLEYAMLLLPLVHKIREQVGTWRDNNYSGASYTYWSVDFDFESKHEIIRIQDSQTGEWEEQWTGDYVFENEWQSFRTKQDRSLELTSVAHECEPGRRKLAVKVVDIFGNDTMTIVEVSV